jgi:Fic family protein
VYAPARYRRACDYEAFVPEPVAGFSPTISGEVAGIVSDAEGAVRALNARAQPALAPLARLLLRTESIASSKVEGLQLGGHDLARAEARMDGGGRAGPLAREILANIAAMEIAVNEASGVDELRLVDVLEIHRVLMQKSHSPRIAGLLREEQNWIGGNDHNPCGAAFVGPPPTEVGLLMADLCTAVNEEHLPPVVQAAVTHAQFETIHPFLDGNGRTGRALIHVVLRRRGVAPAYVPPVSVVLAQAKGDYVDGLTRFREGDVEGWISHFAVATARAAGLAAAYLTQVELLQADWGDRLRKSSSPRADSVAWRIIAALPAHPVITVAVAVAVTGRTKAVVGQAVGRLEDAGVLTRMSGGERNRVWEAAGLLDLIGALESGLTPAR